MDNNELRLRKVAIDAALSVGSPCAKPYDMVCDLLKNADLIFNYIKTGSLSKSEETINP